MFTTNPFASVMDSLPTGSLHVFIVLMVVAVAMGTSFDMYHKGSAQFFARRRERAGDAAKRPLSGIHTAYLALVTFLEAAVSGEFCKWQRRLSHLLMMYGFLIYVAATVVLVFAAPASGLWPALWDIGALMIFAGGVWFFLFLRVNVAHDGHSRYHVGRADVFVLLLIGSSAFGLLWHFIQSVSGSTAANLSFFGIYIFMTTLLFVSVPWSKFAHMFYKPAVAFQRRVEDASGAADLPDRAPRRESRR